MSATLDGVPEEVRPETAEQRAANEELEAGPGAGVAQHRPQCSFRHVFPGVNRHRGGPTGGVAEPVLAPAGAGHGEACRLEGLDQTGAGYRRRL